MDLSLPLRLASASPRRAEILTQYGIPFSRVPNLLYEETLSPGLPLRSGVRDLAYRKAVASAAGVSGLVLSADTLVVLDNHILGKPKSLDDAAAMLTALSGRSHEVMTAFCLWDTVSRSAVTRSAVTKVHFRKLASRDILDYIHCFHVLDKAGAYGIQDILPYSQASRDFVVPKNALISHIEGSYWNVMGLPIVLLLPVLKKYTRSKMKPGFQIAAGAYS